MHRDVGRSLSLQQVFLQRRIRHQRRGTDRVGLFFVSPAVVAIHYLTTIISRHYGKSIWLMAQKHVTDLFHQRCIRARAAVRRIEYYQFHAIGQRTSAA